MPITKTKLESLINNGDISIEPFNTTSITDNGYTLHVGTEIIDMSAALYNEIVDSNDKTNTSETYPIYRDGFIICPNKTYVITLCETVTCDNYSTQIVPVDELASYGITLTTASNIHYNSPNKLEVTLTSNNYVTIYPGQEIATIYFTSNISDGIPTGGIIMWSGYDGKGIPAGWALCNGENGTPDLRDRFIVGSGNDYSIGDVGGEKFVTLTVDQLPNHVHGLPTDVNSIYSYTAHSVLDYNKKMLTTGMSGKHETFATGDDRSHENRPPYYALAFIMKL